MDFSFGVVTYNSEDTIIETLESIRYQIENYGNNHSCSLIIADDCSMDNTVMRINHWLEKYGSIFQDVKIITSDMNKGVCVNYTKMINAINTEKFVQLAGDDLLCSHNIFKKYEDLDDSEIRVYVLMEFSETNILQNEDSIAKHIYNMKFKHTNKKDLSIMQSFPPYRSVEIVFLKKYYSEKCLEYLNRYKNFEDDPSIYYILKHNPNIHFNFIFEPHVLYRRSQGALTTSSGSSAQLAFLDDLYQFRKDVLINERNINNLIVNYLAFWNAFLMKHRFGTNKTLYRKLYKKINDNIVKKGKNIFEFNDIHSKYKIWENEETQFIHMLNEQAKKFLNEQDV